MSTKNVKQTKRPHSGKLGKKQVEFIYNLRGRHTMRIKAEFKKRYGYDIAANRIKSAIQSYQATSNVKSATNSLKSRKNLDRPVITVEFNGEKYSINDFGKKVAFDILASSLINNE